MAPTCPKNDSSAYVDRVLKQQLQQQNQTETEKLTKPPAGKCRAI
jgi:hypothetical protein